MGYPNGGGHPNGGRKKTGYCARILAAAREARDALPACCTAPNFVYIAVCEVGLAKIGKSTKESMQRLDEVQAGCPVPLDIVALGRNGNHAERLLHARFAQFRRHGEWFDLEPVLQWLSMRPSDQCLGCYEISLKIARDRAQLVRSIKYNAVTPYAERELLAKFSLLESP